MAVTVANCFTTNGTPATAASAQEVIYPSVGEGAARPTPAQAAANVNTAIAALTPQPGVL
jgi:hypothetical protein